MQIPAILGQTLTESLLWGETWGFIANGNFLFALLGFFFTLILAVTERVGATITKKKNYFFLLWVAEELSATITVRATFFF